MEVTRTSWILLMIVLCLQKQMSIEPVNLCKDPGICHRHTQIPLLQLKSECLPLAVDKGTIQ